LIIVSNTSPLTNLAAIHQFQLLHRLYGQIYIAEGVLAELNAFGKAWPGSKEVSTASWIVSQKVQNQGLVTALRRDLDIGEAETIALALELKADLVFLDERDGRYAAQRLGLEVIGVIGILLEAKSKGQIESLKPNLDNLRQLAGFYIHDSLFQYALHLANEFPESNE